MLSCPPLPRRFFGGTGSAAPAVGVPATAVTEGPSENSRSPWGPCPGEDPRTASLALPPDLAAIPVAALEGSLEIPMLPAVLGRDAGRALAFGRAFGRALDRAFGRALERAFGRALARDRALAVDLGFRLADGRLRILLGLRDLAFLLGRFPAMKGSSVEEGPDLVFVAG